MTIEPVSPRLWQRGAGTGWLVLRGWAAQRAASPDLWTFPFAVQAGPEPPSHPAGASSGDEPASLRRQRGSLTVWFTDERVAAWAAGPRTTRGGQPWQSPLATLAALTLSAAFRLARQKAGG